MSILLTNLSSRCTIGIVWSCCELCPMWAPGSTAPLIHLLPYFSFLGIFLWFGNTSCFVNTMPTYIVDLTIFVTEKFICLFLFSGNLTKCLSSISSSFSLARPVKRPVEIYVGLYRLLVYIVCFFLSFFLHLFLKFSFENRPAPFPCRWSWEASNLGFV